MTWVRALGYLLVVTLVAGWLFVRLNAGGLP